jgi:hypothetical protein
MVNLLFADGLIEITDLVRQNFKMIQMIFEDCPDSQDIPISVVDLRTTRELVHYAEHGQFTTSDHQDLINIALAANFYDYQECMDEACRQIAEYLKGKSPEFVRRVLAL